MVSLLQRYCWVSMLPHGKSLHLPAHYGLAWRILPGEAKTIDPGSAMQGCRECRARWVSYSAHGPDSQDGETEAIWERCPPSNCHNKLGAVQAPEHGSTESFWMNFLLCFPLAPFLWGWNCFAAWTCTCLWLQESHCICHGGPSSPSLPSPSLLSGQGQVEWWIEAWSIPLPGES